MSNDPEDAAKGSLGSAAQSDAERSAATPIQQGGAVPELESCLVLVASHAASASLVQSVTAEAARRVMLSPVLASFIDLKFVDLGPEPRHGEDSLVLSRITGPLSQPRPNVERSFFSIVVIDKLATAAEAILEVCAASLFLDELPVRLRGIASIEDRIRVPSPENAEILVSPRGAWLREELVRELRRYADELLHELAGAPQKGVSAARLTELSELYQPQTARRAVLTPTGTASGSLVPIPDAVPAIGDQALDHQRPPSAPPTLVVLDPVAAPATLARESRPVSVAPPESEQNNSGPQVSALEPSSVTTMAMTPAVTDPVPSRTDNVERPAASADARPMPRGSLPRLRHLLPQVRWTEPDHTSDQMPERLEATTTGLVYLLLTGDESTGDRDEWSRARTVMLEVDKRLAALSQVSCDVRVLHGSEGELQGELRQAGKLRKRHLRGALADLYFAEVLLEISKVLRRDQGSCEALDRPLNRPAVVFLVPEPPLADSSAVEALRALDTEASVVWVVPWSQADLLSDDFKGAARVLTDYETVPDDVAALVSPNADIPAPPRPAPAPQSPGHAADGDGPATAPSPEVAAVDHSRQLRSPSGREPTGGTRT